MTGGYVLRSGIAVALLAIALPVQGQTQPPAQRGYLVGFGGAASTEVTSPYFGGSFGMNLTRDLQVTLEISRAQDVYADFTKTDLGIVDRQVSATVGLPWTSSVKMPTNFYTGGLRYLLPISGPARPYVAGSGGVAHMSPQTTFTLSGIDVSGAMAEEQVIQTIFREETRPVATLTGGVAFTVARHLTFDLGYRYSRIFINTDYLQDFAASPTSHSGINVHRVFAGAGFTF
jgi:opacity protein-like surface antigen